MTKQKYHVNITRIQTVYSVLWQRLQLLGYDTTSLHGECQRWRNVPEGTCLNKVQQFIEHVSTLGQDCVKAQIWGRATISAVLHHSGLF
jgi:hypothetical protein